MPYNKVFGTLDLAMTEPILIHLGATDAKLETRNTTQAHVPIQSKRLNYCRTNPMERNLNTALR